jgi:hypothetical protein
VTASRSGELTVSDHDGLHPSRPLFARFTLCPADQYTAAKKLQAWEAGALSQEDQGERAELQRRDAIESEVNESEYAIAQGRRAATFGAVFQLLNDASGELLQIHTTVAEEDPTALSARLDGVRSKASWMRIQPGFRTRLEGEPVRMGDSVLLQSVKMPSMYLHTEMCRGGGARRHRGQLPLDTATRFKIVPIAKFAERPARAAGRQSVAAISCSSSSGRASRTSSAAPTQAT